MRSMQGGKLTQEKQMLPSNLNDATIHDEFNNETTQRRCPKAGEYINIQNEMHDGDIAILWEEN